MHKRLPIPPDLLENPQLAAIVLLERALQVTELALIAAYPEFWDDDPDTRSRREEHAYADAIFYLIHALEPLLGQYQRSLTRGRSAPLPDEDDIPF